MSQLGSIVRDDDTTFTHAPQETAPQSHGLRVLHDQIQQVYVHDCTEEDAQKVLRMSDRHHFLVRKSKPLNQQRVYKVAVYGQAQSDVYDESLALTLLHHYPQRFIAKKDTVELFHSVRTPPNMRLHAGGGARRDDTPSIFLHASGVTDTRVKSLLQGHFAANREHVVRGAMQHVLLRLDEDDGGSSSGVQWVDAFYTPTPDEVGAAAQKVPIYTKRMALHKAAARFMDAVVIPSFAELEAGGTETPASRPPPQHRLEDDRREAQRAAVPTTAATQQRGDARATMKRIQDSVLALQQQEQVDAPKYALDGLLAEVQHLAQQLGEPPSDAPDRG